MANRADEILADIERIGTSFSYRVERESHREQSMLRVYLLARELHAYAWETADRQRIRMAIEAAALARIEQAPRRPRTRGRLTIAVSMWAASAAACVFVGPSQPTSVAPVAIAVSMDAGGYSEAPVHWPHVEDSLTTEAFYGSS